MEQLYVDRRELLGAVQQDIADQRQEVPIVPVTRLERIRAELRAFLGTTTLARAMLLLLLSANLVAVVLLIVFLVMILVRM
jgi:hypothetical protein